MNKNCEVAGQATQNPLSVPQRNRKGQNFCTTDGTTIFISKAGVQVWKELVSFHNEQKPKKKNYSRSLFRFFSWRDTSASSSLSATLVTRVRIQESDTGIDDFTVWTNIPWELTEIRPVRRVTPSANHQHAWGWKAQPRSWWNHVKHGTLQNKTSDSSEMFFCRMQWSPARPQSKSLKGKAKTARRGPPASYWTPGPYLCRTALQAFPSSNRVKYALTPRSARSYVPKCTSISLLSSSGFRTAMSGS